MRFKCLLKSLRISLEETVFCNRLAAVFSHQNQVEMKRKKHNDATLVIVVLP
jgi:hypothetical protein